MNYTEEKEVAINHQFDYSNSIADISNVINLIKYGDTCYNQLIQICEQEEEKNSKLKQDYKFYQYKKMYTTKYEILIREKNSSFQTLTLKGYEQFMEAVNNGQLNNVEKLIIELNLSYKRGKYLEEKEHENIFKISFQPYNIVFSRQSNYEDEGMNQMENAINNMLKNFQVINTIFCTK